MAVDQTMGRLYYWERGIKKEKAEKNGILLPEREDWSATSLGGRCKPRKPKGRRKRNQLLTVRQNLAESSRDTRGRASIVGKEKKVGVSLSPRSQPK